MIRFLVTVLVLTSAVSAQDPLQKNMLTDDLGYGQRFVLRDISWPANHGDAEVCLWEDDMIAAISLGVDDNTVPDHDWWLSMADKYDFKMTWWAVTDWFESGANPSFYGLYSDFQELHDAGHEIGSHSWNHDCGHEGSEGDYWDIQMDTSNAHLENNITGLKVKTYAGPCGKLPSADTTKKYYISARGTTGGLNGANKIRYYNTKPFTSGFDSRELLSKTSTGNWWWSWRGWQVMFWHYLQGNNAAIETTVLMPLAAKKDSIWIGRYDHVAMYGQSRDTHTLTVTGTEDSMITFTLTDSMNDELFDYPLTVKVRLNNDWDTCIATQNGSSIEAVIVENSSNKYALVKAVPDKGEVTLTTETQTTKIKALANIRTFEHSNSEWKRLFRLNGEMVPAGIKPGPGVYMVLDNGKMMKQVIVR